MQLFLEVRKQSRLGTPYLITQQLVEDAALRRFYYPDGFDGRRSFGFRSHAANPTERRDSPSTGID
jgi:hypothetical protein